MPCASTIRRLEEAYRLRAGCQLTDEDVVNLSLVHEIADAAGIAADLDAEERDATRLRGG